MLPMGGMNMKRGLLALVALAGLGLFAPPAQAWGWGHNYIVILDWHGYYTWPAGTTWEQRIVDTTHPHWYQQQVPTIVPRTTYRLESTPVKTYVYVAKEVDEVQRQVTYVPVARVVDEQVSTTLLIPFILTGPSGTPIVSCRPEIKTHNIKRTVHDMKPVVKEYKVKVTRQVPEERITQVQTIVPVTTYDQVLSLQWQQTQVPAQQLVTVPVFYPHHAPANFWP
jgi:hypothetical protein